jgi:hypothetical protein
LALDMDRAWLEDAHLNKRAGVRSMVCWRNGIAR